MIFDAKYVQHNYLKTFFVENPLNMFTTTIRRALTTLSSFV